MQYWAEKALPAGLGVDIRYRVPEIIAIPLLEVQPAHVIGDQNLGCIGAPGSPPGALHAAWPPVRTVPVLGRRPGVSPRNQSVCTEKPCGMGELRAVVRAVGAAM